MERDSPNDVHKNTQNIPATKNYTELQGRRPLRLHLDPPLTVERHKNTNAQQLDCVGGWGKNGGPPLPPAQVNRARESPLRMRINSIFFQDFCLGGVVDNLGVQYFSSV